MGIHHLFPWVFGVLFFSTIILVYIKVKVLEKLSKQISTEGGLKNELLKYKKAPHLYESEYKGDIQNTFKIGRILNIFVVLLLVFVGFTFIYFNLKFKGEI